MSGMLDNRYVRGAVVVLGGVLVMSFDAALIRAVDLTRDTLVGSGF